MKLALTRKKAPNGCDARENLLPQPNNLFVGATRSSCGSP